MDSIVRWAAENIPVSPLLLVFIISLFPILELRGGLIAAALLKIPMWQAIPVCVLGNIIPIPFILLFIKQIFAWLKKIKPIRPLIEKLEARAEKKSKKAETGEFWALVGFVGIPLPGTGGWTGALVASFLNMKLKKSVPAILIGIVMATVIMTIVSYVIPGFFFS